MVTASPLERRWRNLVLLLLIITILAVGGVLALGAVLIFGVKKEVVPYVVQVDQTGAVTAVKPAERLQIPDNTVIAAQLARWLKAIRTVDGNAAAQRSLVTEAYAMLDRTGAAYNDFNEQMRKNHPFSRAGEETISVDVSLVLPLAGPKWRMEWREETRGRDTALKSTLQYQAIVTINFAPPRDEATIRANPIGLYVSAFEWGQL
jgi:type IV secretion system protein TrbF